MLGIILFEVFLKAFLLLILLYIVASDEADYDFRKVLMVTSSIILGATVVDVFLTPYIGLLTLVPIMALVVFAVMRFCWVGFWRALLVAVPFLVLNIMISAAVSGFQQKADEAMARGLKGPVSDEDMQVALSLFRDGGNTNTFFAAMQPKAPPPPPSSDKILMTLLTALLAGKKAPAPAPAALTPPPAPSPASCPEPPAATGAGLSASDPEDARYGEDWKQAEKLLRMTGVMEEKNGVRVAMVNGQVIHEGECASVEYKKTTYRWRADKIRRSRVSWVPVEAIRK